MTTTSSWSELKTRIESCPLVIIQRWLQRRLVKSLLEDNDATAALEYYNMTVPQWQIVVFQEHQKRHHDQQQQATTAVKQHKRRTSFWSFLFQKKKNAALVLQIETNLPARDDERISSIHDSTTTTTSSVLQQCLDPTAYFPIDAYRHYWNDAYDDEEDLAVLEQQKRTALQWPWQQRRRQKQKHSNHSDCRPGHSCCTTTTTTLVHEAARLGHLPLVQACFNHTSSSTSSTDWTIRNGQQQTILHMVAGGDACLKHDNNNNNNTSTTKKRSKSHKHQSRFKSKRQEQRKDDIQQESMQQQQATLTNNNNNNDDERLQVLLWLLQWTPQTQSQKAQHRIITNNRITTDGTTAYGLSLNSIDTHGRTALHYAAATGRLLLIQTLLDYNYSVGTLATIVDVAGQTPCDVAAAAGYWNVATYLEARTVLYCDDEIGSTTAASSSSTPTTTLDMPFSWYQTVESTQHERELRIEQCWRGLRVLLQYQQKQLLGRDDKNDVILKQIHDIDELLQGQLLHHNHVQQFLAYFKWDRYEAFDSFFNQSWKESFEQVGISFPLLETALLTLSSPSSYLQQQQQQKMCLICCEEFPMDSDSWINLKGCHHSFCMDCMGEYLSGQATTTSGLVVKCPHHDCQSLLHPDEVSSLVPSMATYQSMIKTSNDNFVVQAHDVRYCPHPGCNGVVRFVVARYAQSYVVKKGLHPDILQHMGAVCCAAGDDDNDNDHVQQKKRTRSIPQTSQGVRDIHYHDWKNLVQPKEAHRFCFVCGEQEQHWPITCQKLVEWKDTVQDKIRQVGLQEHDQEEKYTDIAQKLWMKTNTRPCPKCRAPIQKNDGCNHMTCGSCSHEFCWICLAAWKLHNSRTGGYFRCNRWVDQKEHDYYDPDHPDPTAVTEPTGEDLMDPSTMAVTYGTAMHESHISAMRSREMSRFLHHYRRWGAHAESAALERQMKDTTCERLAPVVQAAAEYSQDPDLFGGIGISFIHAAFVELLECRSILKYTYAFSFLRYQSIHSQPTTRRRRLVAEVAAFEERQGDLEMITEQISNVVARKHLRATQSQIQYLTEAAIEKRKNFSDLMINILVEEAFEQGAEAKIRQAMPKELVKEMTYKIKQVRKPIHSTSSHHSHHQSMRSITEHSTEQDQIEAAILASLEDHGGDHDDLASQEIEWDCHVCTFHNQSIGRVCIICGAAMSTGATATTSPVYASSSDSASHSMAYDDME